MTSNGCVQINDSDVPITFEFHGDDDIWIFIDDELVLDIGGDHGAVTGKIDFATSTASTIGRRQNEDGTIEDGTLTKSFTQLDPQKQHVITLYYMERGLWESNMYIKFNFPQSNRLDIEKEIVVRMS